VERTTLIEIPLTQNKVALIDDEDYEKIKPFKWCASYEGRTGRWYAVSRVSMGRVIRMHRLILDAEGTNLEVDHKDNDGLNNQRNNIRLATRGQNNANRVKGAGFSSEFKGVYWDDSKHKWAAQICVDYQKKTLGRFSSEVEAAKAYDEAALEAWGEFAKVNFPEEEND